MSIELDEHVRDTDGLAAEKTRTSVGIGIFTELLLFFGGLLALEFVLFGGGWIASTQPHVFWIPVVFISLQYGTVGGLIAAATAVGLSFVTGWVPQGINEDFYQFTGRVLKNPVLWLAAAILIGEFRRFQILEHSILRQRLLEARHQRDTISDYCKRLMERSSSMERRLNCRERHSPEDMLASLANLNDGNAAQFGAALAIAGEVLFQAEQTTLYLMSPTGKLMRIEQGETESVEGRSNETTLSRALINAVVGERRYLSDVDINDQFLLAEHGSLAGPVLGEDDGAAIGMIIVRTSDPRRDDPRMLTALQHFCTELALKLESRGTVDLFGDSPEAPAKSAQNGQRSVVRLV